MFWSNLFKKSPRALVATYLKNVNVDESTSDISVHQTRLRESWEQDKPFLYLSKPFLCIEPREMACITLIHHQYCARLFHFAATFRAFGWNRAFDHFPRHQDIMPFGVPLNCVSTACAFVFK